MLRVTEHLYAPASRQARHAHEHASVSLVIAGSLKERVGGVEEIGRSLSMVVKPADVDHEDEFGVDGAQLLQIHLDNASACDFIVGEPSINRWRWFEDSPAIPSFLRLLVAVRAGADVGITERLVVEVMAMITPPEPISRARPPVWLNRVRTAIDDSVEVPCVADLAMLAGVHRVHLARQFRRFYGRTVSEYVRRRRVQRVAQSIAGTHDRLSTVAVAAGFSDQPHLCRVFRDSTGLTPSAFRALSRRQ